MDQLWKSINYKNAYFTLNEKRDWHTNVNFSCKCELFSNFQYSRKKNRRSLLTHSCTCAAPIFQNCNNPSFNLPLRFLRKKIFMFDHQLSKKLFSFFRVAARIFFPLEAHQLIIQYVGHPLLGPYFITAS